MNKILIAIPTYNEAENVGNIYSKIRNLKLNSDILFIDDNSPDGTAQIVRDISKKDARVKLLLRKKKEGIGTAHIAGINWAYKNHYKILITMDCDLTHKPEDINKFLKHSDKVDIVVGSRFINANSLSEWNLLRTALTKTGHFLTKLLLNIKYDATGAFRLYRLDKIRQEVFKITESKGYSFFFESLFILSLNGARIKEVPINLPARTYGSSKMNVGDIWKSLKFLFQTYYLSKIYRDSYIYSPPLFSRKRKAKDEKEWDNYWQSEKKKRKILYDITAAFYRKYIIKRRLNHYIKKFFKNKSEILHAGCGGGQVDLDVVHNINITALDISSEALNRYKRQYGDLCKVIHGSVMRIPSKNEQYDGIYNLGVMEHFDKKDIERILAEFHRVLKDNGKIILFWPPSFGLSVIFLNTMHFILNNILKKNIRLHPHEITKIKSKKQIKEILKNSGFNLKGFYFGPEDLFTYVIVVGEKA